MTRRGLLAAAGAGAAGAALSRLGAPLVRTASAQGARTVTVALYADAISLDPEDTNDNLSLSIEREVYDGLLGFTPDMKITPQLAVSWEASRDARVFTFHLRQGVKFHDGTPFNAAAVKENFDRARDPQHKLKKFSLYQEISSVEAVNDSTVRFTLRNPFGAMLYNFAHPSSRIISPAALAKGEAYIARNPVGTGPFKFVSWTPGQQIVLERNPDFWQSGQPQVDRLVFRFVPEDASRVAMLLSGEAQFVYPVPGVQVAAVSKAPGVTVQKRWSIYAYYVAMNTQHEPYRDVKVRQALNYAVDKNAIDKVVLRDFGRPLDAPMAPGVAGYSQVQAGGWPYDVAKARQLLNEGGFPKGFETTMWLGNQTEAIRLGETIQQMLAKVGVTVHLQPMEVGTLSAIRYKPLADNQSQMNLSGWSPSTGDADWALRPLFDGESWPPTLFNLAFYKNAQVDALLLDALSTADQARRDKDYAEASRIIWSDAPWIFLYNPQILAGVRSGTTGVYALGDGTVDVREAALTGR
jgi:glutathione transport system substrate-binding protein